MKNSKKLLMFALILSVSFACSDDDTPPVVNEEEVITTVTIDLVPQTGATVTLTSRDLDGDGPNAPELTVSGPLETGMLYTGSIEVSNETVTPAEVINSEIEEEADAHQFFFQVAETLNATISYADSENTYLANGSDNPVGLSFRLQAGGPSSGLFTVTLRHEPAKEAAGVAEGDITNAGGETDLSQSFMLSIE